MKKVRVKEVRVKETVEDQESHGQTTSKRGLET